MSSITDAPLQVADKNMVPAVFRNMKSTITDIYCNRRYQQSSNSQIKRGDDLDTGLTCAAVILLQTAIHDKESKWNGFDHNINDYALRTLFHKYIRNWCIYQHNEPPQKDLFFQNYLLHEKSKNKFSAGGFLAYHLIKFFFPGAVEHLTNVGDILKATILLPSTIDQSGAHLVNPSLGRSAWSEPFYESAFDQAFSLMSENIITFNSFLCYMQDVIAKFASDECKADLENSFFFEYKTLPGLVKIFQPELSVEYLMGIFSKPTWLSQRVKSMMSDLERRQFIEPVKDAAPSIGYLFHVNVPKVDTLVASLLLLNV